MEEGLLLQEDRAPACLCSLPWPSGHAPRGPLEAREGRCALEAGRRRLPVGLFILFLDLPCWGDDTAPSPNLKGGLDLSC